MHIIIHYYLLFIIHYYSLLLLLYNAWKLIKEIEKPYKVILYIIK